MVRCDGQLRALQPSGQHQLLSAEDSRHPFYSGILADQHQADPDRLRRAVEASLSYSDGLMLFDICHLIACPALWQSLEEGMRNAGMQK